MTPEYAKGVMFAMRVLARDGTVMTPGEGYKALVHEAMKALSNDAQKPIADADTFFDSIVAKGRRG